MKTDGTGPRMAIEESRKGNVVVIRLKGRLNFETGPELKNCIDSLLDEGLTSLYIQMEDVPLMDSTGLGNLIGSLSLCRKLGCSLTLVAPSEKVLEVLRISKLLERFQIVETEEAIEAIGPSDTQREAEN